MNVLKFVELYTNMANVTMLIEKLKLMIHLLGLAVYPGVVAVLL